MSTKDTVDFNWEEVLFNSLKNWYPFIHGFFLIKTTKSNQFFFFGVYKQYLNVATYLKTAAIKSFSRIKKKLDYDLFSENLSYFHNHWFRIDYFMSSGSFGYVKKDKTSYLMLEEVQQLILENFLDYTTQYKIDFFFLYIKGSFKHTKTIYNHFTTILKDNLEMYEDDIHDYKVKKKFFFKRLRWKLKTVTSVSKKRVSSRNYVYNIRRCLSKALFLAKSLNWQIPQDGCLVANVVTMKYHLIQSSMLEDYIKFPYVFLSKNWSSIPYSIYTKQLPDEMHNFIRRFDLKYYLKHLLNKKEMDSNSTDKREETVSEKFIRNLENKKKIHNAMFAPHGSKKSKPNTQAKNNSKSTSSTYIQQFTKSTNITELMTLVDTLKVEEPSKESKKRSKYKPDTEFSNADQSATKELIDIIEKKYTHNSTSNNASGVLSNESESLIEKVSIFYKSKFPTKLQSVLKLKDWYDVYIQRKHYNYVYTTDPVTIKQFLRCLLKNLFISGFFLASYTELLRLNYSLRLFFLTMPRSFTVVDITSYAFNGCRRTRHYHKNRSY